MVELFFREYSPLATRFSNTVSIGDSHLSDFDLSGEKILTMFDTAVVYNVEGFSSELKQRIICCFVTSCFSLS